MREYYLVELIRFLERAELNGTFGDDKGCGIFILNAKSLDEATQMCEPYQTI